jgi:hypothetical protein
MATDRSLDQTVGLSIDGRGLFEGMLNFFCFDVVGRRSVRERATRVVTTDEGGGGWGWGK